MVGCSVADLGLLVESGRDLVQPHYAKAVRRGSVRPVREPVGRVRTLRGYYNPKARPFNWTATADSILQKIERLDHAIYITLAANPTQCANGKPIDIQRARVVVCDVHNLGEAHYAHLLRIPAFSGHQPATRPRSRTRGT